MCLDKVSTLMAQKVHDLVFVSASTPVLDLTWSKSEGVMMMTDASLACVFVLTVGTRPAEW